jgi:hypothetical protein
MEFARATATATTATATSTAPRNLGVPVVTPAAASASSRSATPAATATAPTVDPDRGGAVGGKDRDDSLSKRMAVDKNVIDELLLVCGVIGTAVSSSSSFASEGGGGGGDRPGQQHHHHHQPEPRGDLLVPVTDCLNWLQDLQRALRRDDDQYRPISLLVGDWRVVGQKLLPVALSCRYDAAIVLTVCKILVILTKPLAENTKRAGRMVIDTKKMPPEYVRQYPTPARKTLSRTQDRISRGVLLLISSHIRFFFQKES